MASQVAFSSNHEGYPNEDDMVDELKNFILTPPETPRKIPSRFQIPPSLASSYDLSDGKCEDSIVQHILNITCETFNAFPTSYFLMGVVFEPLVNSCQEEVQLTLRPLSHLTTHETRRGWSLNELYPSGSLGMFKHDIAKANEEEGNIVLGGICCVVAVTVTWMPYLMYGNSMAYIVKVVFSVLLSNVSVCFGLETILFFEET
ncbi:unnamed protein product, partial [Cyprideis torosa]